MSTSYVAMQQYHYLPHINCSSYPHLIREKPNWPYSVSFVELACQNIGFIKLPSAMVIIQLCYLVFIPKGDAVFPISLCVLL